jgi:Pol polyprotein
MSPFLHHFTNLHTIPSQSIVAANGSAFSATSMGDLKINVPNSSSSTTIMLKNILYTPNISLTIIAIGKIADAGYSIHFDSEAKICKIKNKSGKTIGKITKGANGLYWVDHLIAAAAVQV